MEGCLNVLGVLAGLNRRYYSTFQFKRARAFEATLPLAMPDGRRASSGRSAPLREAARRLTGELEALVAETVALVEAHLPGVDTLASTSTTNGQRLSWRLPHRGGGAAPSGVLLAVGDPKEHVDLAESQRQLVGAAAPKGAPVAYVASGWRAPTTRRPRRTRPPGSGTWRRRAAAVAVAPNARCRRSSR